MYGPGLSPGIAGLQFQWRDSNQFIEVRFARRGSREQNGQPLKRGRFHELLVGNHKGIEQAQPRKVKRNRQLQSVQGLDLSLKTVSSDQLPGPGQVVLAYCVYRKAARGDILKHAGAVTVGRFRIQFSDADLHGENRLCLKDAEIRNSNHPARLGENRRHGL